MEKAIAELAKALKENLLKIGLCFDHLLDVVSNQESRLQQLEVARDIRHQLRNIERSIEDLQDPQKKEVALAEFAALCHALGFENLEA